MMNQNVSSIFRRRIYQESIGLLPRIHDDKMAGIARSACTARNTFLAFVRGLRKSNHTGVGARKISLSVFSDRRMSSFSFVVRAVAITGRRGSGQKSNIVIIDSERTA